MIVTFRLQDEKAREDYARLRVDLTNLEQDIENSAKAQAGVFEQHSIALCRLNRTANDTVSQRNLLDSIQKRTSDIEIRLSKLEPSVSEGIKNGSQFKTEIDRRVNSLEIFRMSQNQVNADLQASNRLRGSYTPEEHRLALRLDQMEHELSATNARLRDAVKLIENLTRPKLKKEKKLT